MDPKKRRAAERDAATIRADGYRRGLNTEVVAETILDRHPALTPLESFRFAKGWSRAELSARIDEEYLADDLAPPGIADATICRWEHGHRRPSDERIAMLCRIYTTRPDKLGFGVDHSPRSPGILLPGLVAAWPFLCPESDEDLRHRIRSASNKIAMFGLTRNAYARDDMRALFAERAAAGVRVEMYVMEPDCPSRLDRYRIEPAEAAMEDPKRYVREILAPLSSEAARHPSWNIWTYNFPCSFAIEQMDDTCRVMLYGHGKRGTEGPIFVVGPTNASWPFFDSQIRWLEKLAGDRFEPWATKGIHVQPFHLA